MKGKTERGDPYQQTTAETVVTNHYRYVFHSMAAQQSFPLLKGSPVVELKGNSLVRKT